MIFDVVFARDYFNTLWYYEEGLISVHFYGVLNAGLTMQFAFFKNLISWIFSAVFWAENVWIVRKPFTMNFLK